MPRDALRPRPTPAVTEKEETFYDDPEICVTCSRLVVRGRTIPLDDVKAVEQTIEEPQKIGWPMALMGIGLVGTWVAWRWHDSLLALALLAVAVAAILWMVAARAFYTVSVVNSAGSAPVVVSRNEQFARAVYLAISQAISRRRAAGV